MQLGGGANRILHATRQALLIYFPHRLAAHSIRATPEAPGKEDKLKLERRSFIKLAGLLAVPAMPALGLGGKSSDDAAWTDDATLLNLGLKKQLFFDNLLIESVQDITREFHQPRKSGSNPLIVKDKPWEHVVLV